MKNNLILALNKILAKEYGAVKKPTKGEIQWVKPDIDNELGEYFSNDFTKDYFKKKGIIFKSKNELRKFLQSGEKVSITREQLKTKFDNLTLEKKDFEDELKNPEYAESYKRMKAEMDAKGITLPTPIIIKFKGNRYYGFAGNRRMNLAFNHNKNLEVWLVDVTKKED